MAPPRNPLCQLIAGSGCTGRDQQVLGVDLNGSEPKLGPPHGPTVNAGKPGFAQSYALIAAPITPRRVGDIPAPGRGPVGGAGERIWAAKSP
jgi:hypothetical protein